MVLRMKSEAREAGGELERRRACFPPQNGFKPSYVSQLSPAVQIVSLLYPFHQNDVLKLQELSQQQYFFLFWKYLMRWHRHLITEIPKMAFNVKEKKNQRTIAQYSSQENSLDTIKGEGTTSGKSVQPCRHLLFLEAALCDCHPVGWFS